MLIIDRNKDFYDHFSHIYGVDNKVVFDRRGSTRINDERLLDYLYKRTIYPDRDAYFMLEVGREQYLIEVSNIQYDDPYIGGPLRSCEMKVLNHFKENASLFNKPITLSPVAVRWKYDFKRNRCEARPLKTLTELIDLFSSNYQWELTKITPILAGTSLTKIIDPFEIWKALQMYISSLNTEKDIELDMTEEAKAETHGFDKQSFRHPIK
jgi:hypothetical protein